ncbi:MAG: 30S ribosomal protein S6 [Deltaproteobacteria bacterium]|nr:30S ribosomal protein S6 [Deltaproteobacteria bacterium]
MRHYETIFIVHPNLSEEDYKEVLRKFTNLVEKLKGVLVKVDEWGNQRLAYRVKKCDRGYYVLMEYCCAPGLIPELGRDMKLDDRVLMFQSVKLADEADPQDLILKASESKKPDTESAEAEPPTPEKQAPPQSPEGELTGEVKSDV